MNDANVDTDGENKIEMEQANVLTQDNLDVTLANIFPAIPRVFCPCVYVPL